ncbi:MAG: Imidazoleglycerol-phosphate dehydratase [Firmicutes bacterium ADurb.Bin193]|nr:MAG: Imidazoleglycerol-phosphate dehydratase [Firmicutes bacterium ADurb.Bin193]
MKPIKVERKTTESHMTVILDFSPITADYRSRIKTPMPFLSHMIEHIVWRGGFLVSTDVRLDEFVLGHVICEDLGICLGKAVGKYVSAMTDEGVAGYGAGLGIIDEAKAECAVSFESRAYADIDLGGLAIPDEVEGMKCEDLVTFLEGFAQGACCTLHLELKKGQNAHHIWEAAFRAFGIALGAALAQNPARHGMTSGVAGAVKFTIE